MSLFVIALVVAGVALALLGALGSGITASGAVIFAFVVALGVLGIGVARKAARRDVTPAACPACGGLVSPFAPYCKHCRAPLEGRRGRSF